MVTENKPEGDGGPGSEGTAGIALGDGQPGKEQGPLAGQVKTFTQEEVNRITAERVRREQEKFADYSDLQAKAKRLLELEDADKSELEKLTNRIAASEQRNAELEAKRIELETTLAGERKTRIASTLALELGAIDPLDANILTATSVIDPDDQAGIRGAIEALKQTKPYLFKQVNNGTPKLEGFNPGTTSGSPETDAQRITRLQRNMGQSTGPLGAYQ